MRRITATHFIIAITCAVSVADVVLARAWDLDVSGLFKATPGWFAQGDVWRPFTASLVHLYGLPHLALNMVGLSLAGPAVEATVGRKHFVALYVASGFVGWVAESALGRGGSGASPAVVGVFAALIFCGFIQRSQSSGERRLVRGLVLSALWLASGPVLNGTVVPGLGRVQIADFSHLGGFITGQILTIAALSFAAFSGAAQPEAPADGSRPAGEPRR